MKPVRTTPQDIETIIESFEKYALEDIIYTKPKPIAAFILSICFIEQLSIFRYKFEEDNGVKPERFLDQYMPEYKGIKIFHKTRHTLVHNYSSRNQFDIDNRGYENVPYAMVNGKIYINTDVFISYLVKAFEKLISDFRVINSEAYKNALYTSTYYPVLVDTRV